MGGSFHGYVARGPQLAWLSSSRASASASRSWPERKSWDLGAGMGWGTNKGGSDVRN